MLGKFFRKPKPDEHFELHVPSLDTAHFSEIAHPQPLTEANQEIIIPPAKPPLVSAKNLALIAVILMLLAGGFAIWSLTRYNALDNLRDTEVRQHEIVLDSLLQVKADLENNLNDLQTAFSDLSTENDTLARQLAEATNIVVEKESLIQEIKNKETRDESALRAQVQRLQSVADRYETIIAVLHNKNASLVAENARLRGAGDSLLMELSTMGKQLETQIRQKLSAQYKASAFRLDMTRRNDKPTIRAKRTRELSVSFELNNVPPIYQGNQQLYLVITDDKGVPIDTKNPQQATIKTEKGNVAILAQASQLQNVIENQHVILNYKLEDRLKKGTYVLSVYSEKGLLGVAGFRLT